MCRHVFALKDGVALKDENIFNMQNYAIQLLTLCPESSLPSILYSHAVESIDVSSQVLSTADYLLRVLSVQLWRTETTTMTLTSHYAIELSPILVCLTLPQVRLNIFLILVL